jgi:hypothetical protein
MALYSTGLVRNQFFDSRSFVQVAEGAIGAMSSARFGDEAMSDYDVVMPQMGARESAERLHQLRPDL